MKHFSTTWLVATAVAAGGAVMLAAAFLARWDASPLTTAPSATPAVDAVAVPPPVAPATAAAATAAAPDAAPAQAPAAGADAALHPVVRLAQQQARAADGGAPPAPARSAAGGPAAPRIDSSALMPFGRTPTAPVAVSPTSRVAPIDPMQPNPDLAAATQRASGDLQSLVQSLREAEAKNAAESKSSK